MEDSVRHKKTPYGICDFQRVMSGCEAEGCLIGISPPPRATVVAPRPAERVHTEEESGTEVRHA